MVFVLKVGKRLCANWSAHVVIVYFEFFSEYISAQTEQKEQMLLLGDFSRV